MSTQTQILYLSYDGLTDSLGQSQVLPYILGLEQEGYSFHIISFEKKEAFETKKTEIEGLLRGRSIQWYPMPYTKRPPVISTIFDLWKMRRKAAGIVKEHKCSIVHARSYLSAIIALQLKQRFGLKFLFDMRGFWADERVEGKLWKLSNPLYAFVYTYFKRNEIQLIRRSDSIVSLTMKARDILTQHFKINAAKIHVIPCCVDDHLFSPSQINEEERDHWRKKLKTTEDNEIVVYLGSIGTWYMLEEMLAYFKAWHLKRPNSIFLFVTGENKEIILTAARKLGLTEAALRITYCERKSLPSLLSLSLWSLCFIRPGFSKSASSPTKLAELMALGIPVLANEGVGDMEYYLSSGYGKLLSIERINVIIQGKEEAPEMYYPDKEAIRNYALQFFSLEKGVTQYRKVYESLGNRGT